MAVSKSTRPHATIACRICGKEFTGPTWNGKRIVCGAECRKVYYRLEARKKYTPRPRREIDYSYISGDKSHLWRGGICKDPDRSRHQARAWRRAVIERDGFACLECGAVPAPRSLVAHHVKPWKDYPELRYDVSNGRTLCRACHNRLDPGIRYSKKRTGIKWSPQERESRMAERRQRYQARRLSSVMPATEPLPLDL